jgi:hypothetical protein
MARAKRGAAYRRGIRSTSSDARRTAMTASTPTRKCNSPRELAHRSSDGLDVSLLWQPADDTPYISVLDHRTHTALQFCVARDAALDAFDHPFAYAPPRQGDIQS